MGMISLEKWCTSVEAKWEAAVAHRSWRCPSDYSGQSSTSSHYFSLPYCLDPTRNQKDQGRPMSLVDRAGTTDQEGQADGLAARLITPQCRWAVVAEVKPLTSSPT